MSQHNWGTRVSDNTTYQGLRALVMENELIRITVLLDKGTDIVEFLHKPTDTDLMWKSPINWKSNANFLQTTQSPITGFMDYYGGGWQECFPSGGPQTEYAGTEIGLHGEVCLIPWQCVIVKDTPEEIQVRCSVRTYRTPFLVEKTFTLKTGDSRLYIHEKITNEGKEDLPYMWGHHPAFGESIIDESCSVDVPAKTATTHSTIQDAKNSQFAASTTGTWPMLKNIHGETIDNSIVPPRSNKTHDLLFLSELTAGWFALTNQKKNIGVGFVWDLEQFPYVWFWQVYGGGSGYPWYGRTYNLALEPWTSMPNDGVQEAVKNGTAKELKAGETVETDLVVVIYTDKTQISNIDRQGNVT